MRLEPRYVIFFSYIYTKCFFLKLATCVWNDNRKNTNRKTARTMRLTHRSGPRWVFFSFIIFLLLTTVLFLFLVLTCEITGTTNDWWRTTANDNGGSRRDSSLVCFFFIPFFYSINNLLLTGRLRVHPAPVYTTGNKTQTTTMNMGARDTTCLEPRYFIIIILVFLTRTTTNSHHSHHLASRMMTTTNRCLPVGHGFINL